MNNLTDNDIEKKTIIDPITGKEFIYEYNYSFIARLNMSSLETRKRFFVIDKMLKMHMAINHQMSWRFMKYSLTGDYMMKMAIVGDAIYVYIPENILDGIMKKINYSRTVHLSNGIFPYLIIISNKGEFGEAIELIDKFWNKTGTPSSKDLSGIKLPKAMTKDDLIAQGFIKEKKL